VTETSRLIDDIGYGWRVETIKSLLPSEKEEWPLSDSMLVAVARATPGAFERNLYIAYAYYRRGETQGELASLFGRSKRAIKSIIYRLNKVAHSDAPNKFLPVEKPGRIILNTLGSVYYGSNKDLKI
jgi:hypothetical protein